MKCTIFIVLTAFLAFDGNAQAVFFSDESGGVDPDRYEEFKGDPYLFDEWQTADIFDKEGKEIKGVVANFNGYSGEMEARKGETIIELDRNFIKKVIFHTNDGDLEFLPGSELQSDYLYAINRFFTDEIQIIEEFFVRLSEKTFNNYGDIREVKRFTKRTRYWMVINGSKSEMKLSKKNFLKQVNGTKEVEKYIKDEKLKMKTIEDYLQVLEYLNASS